MLKNGDLNKKIEFDLGDITEFKNEDQKYPDEIHDFFILSSDA